MSAKNLIAYFVRPAIGLLDPRHDEAFAAASVINKVLADSGEAVFMEGDELRFVSAYDAVRREMARFSLRVNAYLCIDSKVISRGKIRGVQSEKGELLWSA